MNYFKIRILISKVLFWIAEKSLIKGHDSFFTQKEAWNNLSKLTHITDQRNKLKIELNNLKMKIGTHRVWLRNTSGSDFDQQFSNFLEDIPEEWEPNIKF